MLARNWTLAMVPFTAVALATRVWARPTPIVDGLAGLEIATPGAVPPVMVTVTTPEVVAESVTVPKLSVAFAVRAKVPVVTGVHGALKGKVVSVARATPLTKNCTLTTVPLVTVALAKTVWATLTGSDAPAPGPVMETVAGGVSTVKVTGFERAPVTLLPSVATAVRETGPPTRGIHETL